jgi:hypothetical protein
MGVRTRGLDIAINAKRQVADAAARAEAKAVIERWNEQLAGSQDMLWSPTIRAALIAGTPWLDVFCPGCGVRGVQSRRRCRGSLVCTQPENKGRDRREGMAVDLPQINCPARPGTPRSPQMPYPSDAPTAYHTTIAAMTFVTRTSGRKTPSSTSPDTGGASSMSGVCKPLAARAS